MSFKISLQNLVPFEAVMVDQVADIGIEFHASPALRPYHYRANANDTKLRVFDVKVLPLDERHVILKRVLQLKMHLATGGVEIASHYILWSVNSSNLCRSSPRQRPLCQFT